VYVEAERHVGGGVYPGLCTYRAGFAWRDGPGSGPELPGLQIDAASVEPRSTTGLDLSLELREEGGGVAGKMVFTTALFERATVERYTGYLRRLLAGMAADETRPLDRLPLLSDEERRRVVEEWNRTEAPYPAESYMHERFEAQAGRMPDATAVFYEDRRPTYGETSSTSANSTVPRRSSNSPRCSSLPRVGSFGFDSAEIEVLAREVERALGQ
jgi:non-ribosomal peptide synthetase component F